MKTKILMTILVGVLVISVVAGDTEIPANNKGNKGKVIPNSYIVQVVDTDDVDQVAAEVGRFTGGGIGHIYRHALRGFSIHVPSHIRPIDILAKTGVIKVEPDLEFQICQQELPTGIDRIDAELNTTPRPVNVNIAIIDTGIDLDHPDLNVVQNVSFVKGAKTGDDDNGHGSHCAGIAAAIDNDFGVVGVAPGARLWAVKVLNHRGSGKSSDIIAGVDWVTANAGTIEVANMSLGGGGYSESVHTAIRNSVAEGVVYVVSAGNYGADIYGPDGVFMTGDDSQPASYPEVATISAMSDYDGQPGGLWDPYPNYPIDDTFWRSSNFSASVVSGNPVVSPGAAIDLMLPGVSIRSCYKDGGYATNSGTSMSSPHAAGLAALYIAEYGRANDADGVYDIRQALIDGGVAQDSAQGLATLNDPDGNWENIGWAGPLGPIASVSISPSSQSAEELPGYTVIYNFTVTNTGDLGETDTYTISTSSTWDSSVEPTSLTLDSGLSGDVTVTHSVPTGASPGATDSGTLIASSLGTGASDEVTFTTTAQGYAVDITPESQSSSGAPGATFTYTYTVTNTGTEFDSYDVSTTTSTWNSSVAPASLSLDAGQSAEVTVSHTIHEAASDGANDIGTVSVDSSNASDSSTFTTTATVTVGVSVDSITPTLMQAGQTIDVTIKGSGFVAGVDVTFENGSGPAPTASVTSVSANEIKATVTAKSGGPPRNRVWDVRVTNPDASSGVLPGGFTVTP